MDGVRWTDAAMAKLILRLFKFGAPKATLNL